MARPQTSPPRPDAPEQLLERYVAGDAEAFGELVGLYEEKLFAFIARMTGDAHLAEDVFQQTFIKVAQKADVFDGRASFSTWLYRIARNAALDELRKRSREARPVDPDWGGLETVADDGAVSPLDLLAIEETAERVREALSRLPVAQRETFLLKEEGNLGFAEIGEVLGCGRETAKSRFRLAVARIREHLGLERDGGKGGTT